MTSNCSQNGKLGGLVKELDKAQKTRSDSEGYEHVARGMEYRPVGILRYPRCDADYTYHTSPSGCCGPWRFTGVRAGVPRQECGGANAYAGCYRGGTLRPHSPTNRGINRRFNSGVAGPDRRGGVPWGRSHNFGNQTSGDPGVDYGGRHMGNGSDRRGCRNGEGIDCRPEHSCSPIRPFRSSLDRTRLHKK